ncbi:MAG: TIGR00730 family Rossman fold protein, partial [Verrucomicrobia bacterium]|nr:TIGR00730 family Rossman fold protein [Verrucomicrobiota bacterium]
MKSKAVIKKRENVPNPLDSNIDQLIDAAGIKEQRQQFKEMISIVLGLDPTPTGLGDLKQFKRVMREIRDANKVFAPYHGTKKISVFGSARTHPSAPTYKAAHKFGQLMQEAGYMVITGGGEGIMGAAQAGAGRQHGFALNIELPFEQEPNETIRGDSKLFTFKYFFTRKLNFVKHSDAIALFPGGFGTMDEAFESFTLMQTGKTNIIPLIMVDAPRGNFWKTFEKYLREHLLGDKLISDEDFALFKVTDDLEFARREVVNFYYNFHSYRYIGDVMVIRLQRQIPAGALIRLNEDFQDILRSETL